MVHPFVALPVDVLLGAERPLVEHHLGALIDQGAGVAAERHAVLLALEEVLPHLRPDLFEQEADMRRDRIIAQNRVVLLREVANAEQCEAAEDHYRNREQFPHLELGIDNPDTDEQCRDDGANRQNDVARRERKHQRFHGTPPADCAVIVFVGLEPNPVPEQYVTRYPALQVTDMTAHRFTEGYRNAGGKSMRPRGRRRPVFALQRNCSRSQGNAKCSAQCECGRISWGIPLCSRPLCASHASVLWIARSI